MGQYSSVKTNTRVNVTEDSPTVTGVDTKWSSNIQEGDAFTVEATGLVYDVGDVVSDTELTLTAPYKGASGENLHYTIHRDFTTPDNFPEMNQGDIETATLIKRFARKVQEKFLTFVSDSIISPYTTWSSQRLSNELSDVKSTLGLDFVDGEYKVQSTFLLSRWDMLIGTQRPPVITWHNNNYWLLMEEVSDVTEHEPGVSGVWTQL